MNAEMRFCRELTGVDEISERFTRSITERACERFGGDRVNDLLTLFEAQGIAAVLMDANLEGIARAMCYALYTGLLPDEAGLEVERGTAPRPQIPLAEDYFEGLVWRVIQAHPPGLTGGYFGHWYYPPE